MNEAPLLFGWVDYLVFILTLGLSLLVGVYHACKGAASSTTNYLFGGNSMGIFPIAMSFTASALSTQAMLGVTTDVYLHGAMFWWMAVAYGIGVLICTFFYMPIFQDLGILSINEYLELRFHRAVRRLFSGMNILASLFSMSIVTYGSSIALSQVTGLNVYVSATIAFAVCAFYTTIGGMKAVVWSDTIQIFLMIGSMAALGIKGVLDVGIDNVWERNLNSSRLEFFNTDPDPTTQKTVWSMLIGASLYWVGVHTRSQGNYQRYLAVPTRRDAEKAFILNIPVANTLQFLCFFCGLVIYSKYFDCDPIKAKFVEKADQIVPYFAMDTIGSIPGLSGLFVAGIFSASLSTISTISNGVALIVLEDFVRPFAPNLNDASATWMCKGISFGFGLIGYLMVFPVSNVKAIFEASISIDGAGLGMSLGIFTLGMLIPWANTAGAIVGMIASFVSVILLGVFAQAARAQGLLPNNQLKPTSIENCPNSNSTNSTEIFISSDPSIEEEVFYLLRISYFWYTMIGTLIAIIVGTVVSFLTGPKNPAHLNPKLFFHCLQSWIRRKNNQVDSLEMEEKEKMVISPSGKL